MSIKHISFRSSISMICGILIFSGFTFNNTINLLIDEPIYGNLTTSQKVRYKKDATRLALRMIADNDEYQSHEPIVPDNMVNSIYSALVAVHRSELEEAQLVTRIHKLHTFPVPAVDKFLVVYERNIPWARSLRLGDNRTESDEINKFCDQYGLLIDSSLEWDEEHNSMNIRALEALNVASVAEKFLEFEGVTKVDIMIPNGDGNDIEITKTNKGWEINYMIKFDACFTQCKKQRNWKFGVSEEGDVSFIEVSGDSLPKWMAKH